MPLEATHIADGGVFIMNLPTFWLPSCCCFTQLMMVVDANGKLTTEIKQPCAR